MKNKLISIKRIIESEIGERIDTRNRRRDLTYARAIYCRLGRDMGLSLSAIGETLNRDHATVLHSLRVILPFAEQNDYYVKLYQTLSAIIDTNKKDDKPEVDKKGYRVIKSLASKVEELQKENAALKYKLQLIQDGSDPFTKMVSKLSKDELDEVYDKLSIMVRAIENRVYS